MSPFFIPSGLMDKCKEILSQQFVHDERGMEGYWWALPMNGETINILPLATAIMWACGYIWIFKWPIYSLNLTFLSFLMWCALAYIMQYSKYRDVFIFKCGASIMYPSLKQFNCSRNELLFFSFIFQNDTKRLFANQPRLHEAVTQLCINWKPN